MYVRGLALLLFPYFVPMIDPEVGQLAPPVDVLAIAAHRDDIELLCGGTLAKVAAQGYRTGALDLTRGEMGTAGSADLRGEEADAAAAVLGLTARRNAGFPDAGLGLAVQDRLRRAAAGRVVRQQKE